MLGELSFSLNFHDWFPDWVIGVLLAFGGCTLSNFGINMFKLAHNRMAEEERRMREIEEWGHDPQTGQHVLTSEQLAEKKAAVESKTSTVCCHPIWVLGCVCVVLGAILDLVSFAFASVSLLAPIGALTLVVNLFMAPIFLKEKLTSWDVICTIIILIGTVLALVFGDKNNASYSLDELLDLYGRTQFLIFLGMWALVIIIMATLLVQALYRLEKAMLYTSEQLNTSNRYVLVTYPTFAGFAGAASVLCAKSAIEMAKSSASGRSSDDVKNPMFALFIIGAFFAIYVQCVFLNKGLERGDALFIVPVYQVSWVFTNTVIGLVYFRDLWHMTHTSIAIFITGVLIALIGVYLLSLRQKDLPSSVGFSAAATSVNRDDDAHDQSSSPSVAVVSVDEEKSKLIA